MDDATLTAHFDTLERMINAVRSTQDDVIAELGNVPRLAERHGRKTVTDRLHGLEAQTAPTALDAAIERVLRRRRATFWTTTQKLSIFGFAALGALGTLLRIIGWHGQVGILSKPKPPGIVGPTSPTAGPAPGLTGPQGASAPTTLKAWSQLQVAFGQTLPTDSRRAVAAASLYAQAVTSRKRKAKRGR